MTILIVSAIGFPVCAAAGNRVALVVGIGTYDNLPPHQQLKNAVSDAKGVSEKLTEIGFRVISETNPTRSNFNKQWQDVLNGLTEEDTLVLFFSGHGVQVDGQNYLLPRDIPFIEYGRQAQLTREAISLNELLSDLTTGHRPHPKYSIAILDACRDNPLIPAGYKGLKAPSGLAEPPSSDGIFIMYSAGNNRTALDRLGPDDVAEYSVFTRVLLPLMGRQDLSIQELSITIKDEVSRLAKNAGRQQRPAYYDGISGRFCLPGCATNIEKATKDLIERFMQQLRESNALDSRQLLKDLTEALSETFKDLEKEQTGKSVDPKLPNAADALTQLRNGNIEPARKLFEELLARNKSEGKAAYRKAAEAARHLGALAFLTNNEEALKAYREAVALDPDNLEGQNQLANVLMRKGELNEAEDVLIKVMAIAEQHGDLERQAVTAHNLGVIYIDDRKTYRAEEMFRRSLKINESLHRTKGVAANYNDLANLYLQRHDLRQAEDMADKSVSVYETFPDNQNDATGITNKAKAVSTLGIVYFLSQNYSSAEQKICKGLDLFRSVNDKEGIARNLAILGNLYEVRGEISTALALFRQSLKLAEEVKLNTLYEQVKDAMHKLSSSLPVDDKSAVGKVCGTPIL